ncbi:MAG TPA: NADH-quinone oxidoreductase subunit A [Myxococcales bacterium]|nr:NADH-quinone oxidoreductase subunit A [Myxococcales bacterium]
MPAAATSPLTAYLPIAILFVIAGALALLLSYASALVGPHQPTPAKLDPFECGSLPARGSSRDRFGVKFYVVALLFIVFDVEAVFLYPWAVLFKELAWPGLVSMAVFVATVLLGLVYVWKKGALDWEH